MKKRYFINYIERVSFINGDGSPMGVLLGKGWARSLDFFVILVRLVVMVSKQMAALVVS